MEDTKLSGWPQTFERLCKNRNWDVRRLRSNKHNKPKCYKSAPAVRHMPVGPQRRGKPYSLAPVGDHQHWHPLPWQPQLSTNQGCLPPPASWCHSRSPDAKLITTTDRGMHICVRVDVCEEFHMSESTVAPNERRAGMGDNKARSSSSERSRPQTTLDGFHISFL